MCANKSCSYEVKYLEDPLLTLGYYFRLLFSIFDPRIVIAYLMSLNSMLLSCLSFQFSHFIFAVGLGRICYNRA